MALPRNWRFTPWFDHKSNTVVEFDSDRCFFLLWLPNLREICMSMHSCSYVIKVPWNNIQKRLLLSIFFNAEKALASLYICTDSSESTSQYWNIMCWLKNDLCAVYKNSECCGEAVSATMAHQCVVSMRQKMLPVHCNKNPQ